MRVNEKLNFEAITGFGYLYSTANSRRAEILINGDKIGKRESYKRGNTIEYKNKRTFIDFKYIIKRERSRMSDCINKRFSFSRQNELLQI